MRKKVVIGLTGLVLDAAKWETDRWSRWRPTVSIFQHEDLLIDRFELLHTPSSAALTDEVQDDVRSVSPETEVVRHELEFGDEWDFEDVFGTLHDFARNYPFDTDNEDYFVHITTGTHVVQICLFLLTESGHFPAQLMQTSPPKKRQRRSPGRYEFIDLDLSRYDRLAMRFAADAEEGSSFLKSGIATRNAGFNALIEEIERVAIRSKAPILLMGPTGAGKSQLARRIYELKRQRRQVSGEFVAVNCATIRGSGAMAALFGHVKGAYTGAISDRRGLLRSADGGMLFLDEIGELGLEEQAMLLRAVEEKTFTPVGSDREATADFQLICGTNRDLPAECAAGRFRDDLLARINLWNWRLPGLSERPEDLQPNLDYELDRFAAANGQRTQFNKEARDAFLNFATSPDAIWSANFRDLGAAVTRLATLAGNARISKSLVDQEVARLRNGWRAQDEDLDSLVLRQFLDDDAIAEVDQFDRVQLAEVIRVCHRSRSLSEAGRKLFAASRKKKRNPNDADRLRKYLAKFGLEFADFASTQ